MTHNQTNAFRRARTNYQAIGWGHLRDGGPQKGGACNRNAWPKAGEAGGLPFTTFRTWDAGLGLTNHQYRPACEK